MSIMDKVDRQILEILQQDGKISNAEISRRLGMVPSAVLERVRRLERSGCIERYEVRLNPRQLGLKLTVFVALETAEVINQHAVADTLAGLPEIQEIHEVAGSSDYILKIRVADTDELAGVMRRIGALPEVRRARTTLILNPFKETSAVRLKPQQ